MSTPNEAMVFSGPAETQVFAWMSQKQQLKLEAKGLKSRGGALRPRLAAQHDLSPRDSREKFIEVIQAKIDAAVAAKQAKAQS